MEKQEWIIEIILLGHLQQSWFVLQQEKSSEMFSSVDLRSES
jgi:hypothetical protein